VGTFASGADLLSAGRVPLGVTGWRTISAAEVGLFLAATGHAPDVHVEPMARGAPFPRPVAPGYLTLGLAPALLGELLTVTGHALAVGVGLDRVRFPAPAPVGSRVRAHGLLLAARAVGSAVRVVAELSLECDAAARPVCVAQVVTQLFPG
jgi:acyl dehydratase